MVSVIGKIDSRLTFFIGFFVMSLLLIIFISKNKKWSYYGVCSLSNIKMERKYIFIPLLVLAIMPLSAGISQELTLREIGYFFVYMILVAFVEEIVFRGIILRILSRKGIITAIFGSSIMFSVAHLMNTLQAKNLESTIIQTLYAFIIGVILAILVIKTNNIILPIIYHYINNVVSSINTNNETLLDLIITYLMFTLAIIYAVYLLNLIKQDNENIAINR